MHPFSDTLLKFAIRSLRRERLALLGAPAEVVAEEDKLIEEARRQFAPGDEAMIPFVIGFEMLRMGIHEFGSPNCGNCEHFREGGDVCLLTQAGEKLGEGDEAQRDKALEEFHKVFDSCFIQENADRICGHYQLDGILFNNYVANMMPMISAMESRHGINLDVVAGVMNEMLIGFANRTIQSTGGGANGLH